VEKTYFFDKSKEKVDTIKDSGVALVTKLKFRDHLIDHINSAYTVISIFERSDTSLNIIYGNG